MKKYNGPDQPGRHTAAHGTYMEKWAQRYPKSQEAIERDRLARGLAKHRAHLFPITAQAEPVSA